MFNTTKTPTQTKAPILSRCAEHMAAILPSVGRGRAREAHSPRSEFDKINRAPGDFPFFQSNDWNCGPHYMRFCWCNANRMSYSPFRGKGTGTFCPADCAK
jgi:hypothetical protein